MAATFGWVEFLQNATATATPNNLNLGSTLAANLSPSLFPITAGTYSYEKWIRASWGGSFTRIDNVKFWKSAGAYLAGGVEVINFTGQRTTYATPTNSASSFATSAVPTAEPGSPNVSVGGNVSGSLTAPGTTDFIVLQASITSAAPAGAVNTKTLTLQYDEV